MRSSKRGKRLAAAACAALMLCGSALAADRTEPETSGGYALTVEQQEIDLSSLPAALYQQGSTWMVPLRAVGEALGYEAGWNGETGEITLDDHEVQRVTLHNGSKKAVFTGYLSIIDMNREVELPEAVTILEGRTYVPVELFPEFMDDVFVRLERSISISHRVYAVATM